MIKGVNSPSFFLIPDMTKEEINIRLRFVKAKLRNINHYWKYDESLGEVRERKQYIHVLRDLRKQCLMLVQEAHDDVEYLQGIIKEIDPKVKKEECGETIKRLEKYVQ